MKKLAILLSALALASTGSAQAIGDPAQPFPGGWCMGERYGYGPGLLYRYYNNPNWAYPAKLGYNAILGVYGVGPNTGLQSNPIRSSFLMVELGGAPGARPPFTSLESFAPFFGHPLFYANYPCMTRMSNPVVQALGSGSYFNSSPLTGLSSWTPSVIAQDPFVSPSGPSFPTTLFDGARTVVGRNGYEWRVNIPNSPSLVGQWLSCQGVTFYVKMILQPVGWVAYDWISFSNEISVQIEP